MSSKYVRDTVKAFLVPPNTDEVIVDLTANFDYYEDLLSDAGIDAHDIDESQWVGLEFIGNAEEPVAISTNNVQGLYRETGAVYFHVCDMGRLGIGDALITRADALRDLMQGQRLGDIIIGSVSPANTGAGAALQFEGGYVSASFIVSYYRDKNL